MSAVSDQENVYNVSKKIVRNSPVKHRKGERGGGGGGGGFLFIVLFKNISQEVDRWVSGRE